MSLPPSRKLGILRRRQQVAELYLQGQTQMQIAEKLGVAQATVSTDLTRVREQWRDSAVRNFDLAREEEIKKLELIEREAWAAWERSQKPTQEANVKENDPSKATKKMKSRHSDLRCLEIIMRCSASRRAILGLDLAQPLVQINANGVVEPTDLTELRRKMLDEDAYLDYCRTGAIDVDSGHVREDGERGPLANGEALGLPGPGDNGHDPGQGRDQAADRDDAAAARQERAD